MALQTYLSPLRYQHGGYGLDNVGTTVSLRNKLVGASATIDSYCGGSMVPDRHSFGGGSITGEVQIFPYPAPLLSEPGNRRIFLNHGPIIAVSSVSIQYTPQYSISVDSAQLFVSQQGFVEIVAINPTIIGFPPLGYLVGPYEPFAVVDYTYGYRFSATGDVLEALSPTLFMASHGSWLDGGVVSVAIDGTDVDPGDYTVNIYDGTVLFTTAPSPNTLVTATYTYTVPTAIEQATGIVATNELGQARLAARGMVGVQSLRVAEVAITQMSPSQYNSTTRNGVSVPQGAGALLGPYCIGSAA